jgi:hypothetical protein
MAGKSFYYVIDNLTKDKAVKIAAALKAVSDVLEILPHLTQGVLEVKALRDVEAQVKMACSIAGTTFRTRVDRKAL